MQILIIAKADFMRNGFATLLSALVSDAAIDELADLSQIPACLQKRAYDLVFLYPNFPFDEMEAAARLVKKISTRSRTIFIVEESAQSQPALHAGADQVMLKGFNASQLLQTFQESRKRSTAAARI